MKLNSNTLLLDTSDYKELETIISKIASENKIDNVENIHCILTKESGNINFNILRDKQALSFGDIIMNISDVADDYVESGGISGLIQKGVKGIGDIGDTISDWWSGKTKEPTMPTEEQLQQQANIAEEFARGESLANKEQKEREEAAKQPKPVVPAAQKPAASVAQKPVVPIKAPEVPAATKPYKLTEEEQKEFKPYSLTKEEQKQVKQNLPSEEIAKQEVPKEELEEKKRMQALQDQYKTMSGGKGGKFFPAQG